MGIKKLIDFLPKERTEGVDINVQARIGAELFDKANAARKREQLTWKELIEAGLMKFLDEVK